MMGRFWPLSKMHIIQHGYNGSLELDHHTQHVSNHGPTSIKHKGNFQIKPIIDGDQTSDILFVYSRPITDLRKFNNGRAFQRLLMILNQLIWFIFFCVCNECLRVELIDPPLSQVIWDQARSSCCLEGEELVNSLVMLFQHIFAS